MKILLSALFIIAFKALFAQNYKVDQEVTYFDGMNWIETKIIKIEGSKYMVYANREKTKTKWCTSADLEPMEVEAIEILDLKVDYVKSTIRPVLIETDVVRFFNNNLWCEGEIFKIGQNNKYQVYTDSTKTNLVVMDENDITLINATREVAYKTLETTITSVYKLHETIQYLEAGNWMTGKIDKINNLSQVMINSKWYDSDKIRKIN